MSRSDAENLRTALEAGLTMGSRSARIEQGWAESTKATYSAEWRAYEAWCRPGSDEDGTRPRWLTPMPATPETLALYVEWCAQQGLAPATIRKKIDAVLAWHRRRGETAPDRLPALGVLRAHERNLARSGWSTRRASALRVEDAVRILATLDRTRPRGMVDACVVLMAFAGCLRAGEAAGVNLADISEVAEGVRIRIPVDKTTRHTGPGKGVSIPHWSSEDGDHHPALCPVEAVLAWQSYLVGRRAPRTSPLLRFVDKHGRVAGVDRETLGRIGPDARMSTRGLEELFTRLRVKAGVTAAQYSFHSLRVGGATAMRQRGATIEEIADHGRWSRNSGVVIHYIRVAEEWTNNPMARVGTYAVDEHLARLLTDGGM